MYSDQIDNLNLKYPYKIPVTYDYLDKGEPIVRDGYAILENDKDLELLAVEMDGLLRNQHLLEIDTGEFIDTGIIITAEFPFSKDREKCLK